jgi:hypothetical protein
MCGGDLSCGVIYNGRLSYELVGTEAGMFLHLTEVHFDVWPPPVPQDTQRDYQADHTGPHTEGDFGEA